MPRRAFVSLVLATLATLGSTAFAAPAAQPPHTVVDFYLLLPSDYFERENDGRHRPKERLALCSGREEGIVDIPHGYLFAAGDGAQSDLTVCLFKRPDRTYLVGVGQDSHPDLAPFLDFYEYKAGRLHKVTRAVLPVPFNPKLSYQLPRYGTTIRVTNSTGKSIYDLVWQGRKFTVRRAP